MSNTDTHIRTLAAGDVDLAIQHGVDVNPFSTQGMRHLWQHGWNGTRPNNLVDGSGAWRAWERGRLARQITEERAS